MVSCRRRKFDVSILWFIYVWVVSSSFLVHGLSLERPSSSSRKNPSLNKATKHVKATSPRVAFTTGTKKTSTPVNEVHKNRRDFVTQVAAGIATSSILSDEFLPNEQYGFSLSPAKILAHAADVEDQLPLAVSTSSTSTTTTTSKLPRLALEYVNAVPQTSPMAGRVYFPTLTPPFFNRATYRYELGRNMYALEQLLTFANVTATIRTTVVQLDGGSSSRPLWVHSPQWPTGEFCQLLDELGTVEHVVLPCNALEHKAPMAAFIKRYPKASVWISPGQYGPFGSCGLSLLDKDQPCKMGYHVDGILNDKINEKESKSPPWLDEFDYTTLYVSLPENAGPVSEVAFFHKPSKTLIATDAVIYVPDEAPPIMETYFDPSIVRNDDTFWPKTVLQSVFLPLRVEERRDSEQGQGSGNFYYPGYEAIRDRLVRAPILRGFNDARAPEEVGSWIDTIVRRWEFDRIVTSHFASPIVANPQQLQTVFAYLNPNDRKGLESLPPIACQDWELLQGLNDVIAENNLGAPATFDYRAGCIQN